MAAIPLLAGFAASAKKNAVGPKKGKTGERSVRGKGSTQHGELSTGVEPTRAPRIHDKIREDAERERQSAVRNWIAGRIPTHEHSAIHSRANYAIKNARKIGRGQLSEIEGKAPSTTMSKRHKGIW